MKGKEKEKSKENESSNDIRATRFPTSLFESQDSLEDGTIDRPVSRNFSPLQSAGKDHLKNMYQVTFAIFI